MVVQNQNQDKAQLLPDWPALVARLEGNDTISALMLSERIALSREALSISSLSSSDIETLADSIATASRPAVTMANHVQLGVLDLVVERARRKGEISGFPFKWAVSLDEADVLIPDARGDAEGLDVQSLKLAEVKLKPILRSASSTLRVTATQLSSVALRDEDANAYYLMEAENFLLYGLPYLGWKDVRTVEVSPNPDAWVRGKEYIPNFDDDFWDAFFRSESTTRNGRLLLTKPPFGDDLSTTRVALGFVGKLLDNQERLIQHLVDRHGSGGSCFMQHNETFVRVVEKVGGRVLSFSGKNMGRGASRLPKTIGETMAWREMVGSRRLPVVADDGTKVVLPQVSRIFIVAGQKASRGTNYSSAGVRLECGFKGNLVLTDMVVASPEAARMGWDTGVQFFGRLYGRKNESVDLTLFGSKETISAFVEFNETRDAVGPSIMALALSGGEQMLWEDETGKLFSFKPSLHATREMFLPNNAALKKGTARARRMEGKISFEAAIDGVATGDSGKSKIISEEEMMRRTRRRDIMLMDYLVKIPVGRGRSSEEGVFPASLARKMFDISLRKNGQYKDRSLYPSPVSLRKCMDLAEREGWLQRIFESLHSAARHAIAQLGDGRTHHVLGKAARRLRERPLLRETTIMDTVSRTGVEKNRDADVFKTRTCSHRDLTKMAKRGWWAPKRDGDGGRACLSSRMELTYEGKHYFIAFKLKENRSAPYVSDIRDVDGMDLYDIYLGIKLEDDGPMNHYAVETVPGTKKRRRVWQVGNSKEEILSFLERTANPNIQVRRAYPPKRIVATASGRYKVYETIEDTFEDEEVEVIDETPSVRTGLSQTIVTAI